MRLEIYAALLRKWQAKINLVGHKTLADLWRRHMLDSAQLHQYIPPLNGPWLDLGSGAGFPGLVLALLQPERSPTPIYLIESDHRKAVFLQEVIRATRAPAQVVTERIEKLDPSTFGGKAGLITARALAPLHQFLQISTFLTGPSTVFLLLKGQHIDDELTLAAKYRKLTVNQHQSRTNPGSKVLCITEVDRV